MANLKKSSQGYGYKYTDLAQINIYCEENGIDYYQETETVVLPNEANNRLNVVFPVPPFALKKETILIIP